MLSPAPEVRLALADAVDGSSWQNDCLNMAARTCGAVVMLNITVSMMPFLLLYLSARLTLVLA